VNRAPDFDLLLSTLINNTSIVCANTLLTEWIIHLQKLTGRAGGDIQFSRVKKPVFLKKSPTQWFLGVLLGFLDKQEKIGKIIQKLSNLKP